MYDVYSVREDFPVLKEVVYLNSAATTQTPVQAVSAMEDYFFKYAGNHGRGAHRLARQTTDHYEDARENVVSFLNIDHQNDIHKEHHRKHQHGRTWSGMELRRPYRYNTH